MPKQKPNKGLLKRVKVTGTGKVKFKRAGKSHLNSHKSGSKMTALRRSHTAKVGDTKRLEGQLRMRLYRPPDVTAKPKAEQVAQKA
jgi:large subunit ribosomal protein L35